ncbi:hypothetical protein [Parapedobacter sp. DT-150]|uniref:hypothetical protein n=1 Tax=Parapedobacter sp. DT-150 TaxID=3396162 RepID=UPI003F1C48B8
MEVQKLLFDRIRSMLPSHIKPVNEITDLLGINVNMAYDRISGRVPLRLEEAGILCRHFGISLDALTAHKSDTIPFHYVPLAVGDPEQYLRYMLGLRASMERLAAAEDAELMFAADDIPVFHFMPFPELTYFKLYAWNRTMNGVEGSYEQFARSADRPELRAVFRGIAAAYLRVPTIEIWTEETINPILRLLAHYRALGTFDRPETVDKLCGQLLELIGGVQHWATASRKGDDSDVPYAFYLCPVQAGSSIMLTHCDGEPAVRMKLYTINSIATSDSRLCDETRKWLVQTVSKSTNLSGSSEIRRTHFFNTMKEKILDMTT